jgi:DNA-binding response OmpR family regulator
MPRQARTAERKCALIVEDSIDFSNLLKFICEDEGLEGIQFPLDGGDIIEWAQKHKPAVILMDLALRRKGGMEFINELRAEHSTKHIPIIIITGRELSHKEILELQLRDVKYLRKGRVEMEDIKKEIRNAARPKKPSPADTKDE